MKFKLKKTIRKIEIIYNSGTNNILINLFALKQLRTLPRYLEIKYKQTYWT